jgi:hypothetical protein
MRTRIHLFLALALCTVAASASAQPIAPCVRPWAIPDKWIDRHDEPNDGVWRPDDTFETMDTHGNALSNPDEYVDLGNPDFTGFNVERDRGLLLTLKLGNPQDGMKPGWFYAIDTGTAGTGAGAYRNAIASCHENPPIHWGEILRPLLGDLRGPTVQGVADLINLDPKAEWDPVTRSVVNSCAPSLECGLVSPRIVWIVAFNPAVFEYSVVYGGQPQLVAANQISVFIDGVVGGKVTGYLTPLPVANQP